LEVGLLLVAPLPALAVVATAEVHRLVDPEPRVPAPITEAAQAVLLPGVPAAGVPRLHLGLHLLHLLGDGPGHRGPFLVVVEVALEDFLAVLVDGHNVAALVALSLADRDGHVVVAPDAHGPVAAAFLGIDRG